jgi:hypothetical protein
MQIRSNKSSGEWLQRSTVRRAGGEEGRGWEGRGMDGRGLAGVAYTFVRCPYTRAN